MGNLFLQLTHSPVFIQNGVFKFLFKHCASLVHPIQVLIELQNGWILDLHWLFEMHATHVPALLPIEAQVCGYAQIELVEHNFG